MLNEKENEIIELRGYVSKAEIVVKRLKEKKEEEQEEIKAQFLKLFANSQEVLQYLLQISDVPLSDKKMVADLFANHRNGVQNKLGNNIETNNNSAISVLQQHEIEMHQKIGKLCERLYQMICQELVSHETEKKKAEEITEVLKHIQDEEATKAEDHQIQLVFSYCSL